MKVGWKKLRGVVLERSIVEVLRERFLVDCRL